MKVRQGRILRADYPDMLRRVRSGETLASVADSYGTSKQRIHQIIQQLDPDAVAVGRTARRAKQEAQKAASQERTLRARGPCEVCWRPLPSIRCQKTCSPRCARLWRIAKLHLSTERYMAHRRAHARSVLQRSPEPYPGAYDWARGVLGGWRPPNRRYVQPSRAVAEALVEIARLRGVSEKLGAS